MDETKRAWDEVGASFAKLGRIISERYRILGEGDTADRDAAGEGVADALRRAADELDRAFASLGDTLRDDQAREHMRDTGRKLGDALEVTVTAVGEEIRRAVGNRESGDRGGPPPAGPPPQPSA
jgi:hypothetical protein